MSETPSPDLPFQPTQPHAPASQPYAPTGSYPTYPFYGAPPAAPVAPVPIAPDTTSPRRTLIIAVAVAAVVGAGVGAATVAIAGDSTRTVYAGLPVNTQAAPAAKVDGSVTAAAAKIGPSVVTIVVTTSQQQDTGSGVIIRPDGYILTNNHVIAAAKAGAGTIVVTLSDGRRASATIVGTDASDDLAVVSVKLGNLTAATFASSAALQVGQTVVAVGAPLGLSDTVTAGIVSSVARPVQTSDSNNDQAVFNAVQTDAAINPGNSGGPLVNLNGDVVGINAAIATDQSQGGLQVPGQSSSTGNIGIGFAIPSDEAARIAAELIATGKATHAVLGVSVGDVPATGSGSLTSGALIRSVATGGAAAGAGLRVGDIVTSVGSQRIDTADALVAAVRSHAPGQQISITYTRGGTAHTASLTLGTASN